MSDPEGATKPERRRPTRDELVTIVETIVAEQCSLSAACRGLGIDIPTANKAIWADPELRKAYESATEGRGDYYGERVGETAERVLEGEIAPDVGRVAMDGFKWTSARMNRKKWGDRQEVDLNAKVEVTDARERLARVIAGEVAAASTGGGPGGTDRSGG